jgi:hypothetical protein
MALPGIAIGAGINIGGGISIGIVTPFVLTIATNSVGGLTGYSSQATAVTANPVIISNFVPGDTITFQDSTTATITQIDDYTPDDYIEIFWDTPKVGTIFPITLST